MENPNIFEFDSIGSRFWIERLDQPSSLSDDLQQSIRQYCQKFDNDYSRFKEDSLVAELAHTGVLREPPAELIDMLQYAKRIYTITEGVLNITVGATLHKLGYGDAAYSGQVLDDPWHAVTWNSGVVRVPKGLMLDFGGFGKGWMIDHIATILEQAGIGAFIVNGGGDMYVKSDSPVEIMLEDPHHPGFALQSVMLKNCALAGSDTVKRTWVQNGKRQHHIIDPELNAPARSTVVASYVIADSALTADTLATALIVKPALQAKLERIFAIKVLLIPK